MKKLLAHQTQAIPSLREGCLEVSPALDAFGRMVAKAPDERYQSPAEVLADRELCTSCNADMGRLVHPAASEDSLLDAFLHGLEAKPRGRSTASRTSPPVAGAVSVTRTAPPEFSAPDQTEDGLDAQVATEPHRVRTPPGGQMGCSEKVESRTPGARRLAFRGLHRANPRFAGIPPWLRDGKKLAAAGAGGLLLILLTIWVVVRDKEGREVARVALPEGGSVTQEALPAWNLPSGSPPPAVAPFDTATAKEHQEAWAEHLGMPVEYENAIGMKLALIPPGEFRIGSPESEEGRGNREGLQHQVRITRPFFLGVYPVTQLQWESVMGSNPSWFSADGGGSDRVSGMWTGDSPVERISWHDVQKFLDKLNEQSGETGWVYRLPSEAEWEYACRAGTTTRYYFGDDAGDLGDHAWYRENSGGRTHHAGQKRPNAWGLYDMHGNVWEWCSDRFWGNYYANSPLDHPTGPAAGSYRVFRGGSWFTTARGCRSAYRYGFTPGLRSSNLGFRLVKFGG